VTITDQDVESYQTNGFLVVPGLASCDDVAALRADTVRICRGEYPHPNLEPMDEALDDDEVLRNFLCIHHPHKVSPVLLDRGVKHPGVVAVLQRIIGPDVKCMQSMLFVKPPGFQGQAWHQDEIYIPTRDRSLTGGWIALDDATIENGCLYVIPGSHEWALYDQRAHDNPDEFDFAGESYGFDESGEVPVEVKAGDGVFFNGYLLHRSRRNRSQVYRRVLVNHYMNAWSRLPWQIQPGDSASRGDYRDIVMVSGDDPYAWMGLEERAGVSLRRCKAIEELQQA
jgi:phytanoyl-CoA hydroxylase